MAGLYTYDDFTKEAERLGLLAQFSGADLKLAQQNPDAGMSILRYKNDYKNATTDEARMLANQGAEGIRSSYGGYTGGGDGGSFNLNPLSPSSFKAPAAPTYTNNYAGEIADRYKKQTQASNFTYGNADLYKQALSAVMNRQPFSYDQASDPAYQAYAKQYAREGQRATADALGQAAAASGGRVSSWAQTAAQQAGNYYAGQMADRVPELYQQAYNRYLQEFQMNQGALDAALADRRQEYSEFQGNYDRAAQNLNTARALEQDEYNRFLNELGQYNTDRNFNYAQLLDEVNNQRTLRQDDVAARQQELQDAIARAELGGAYGDWSGLEAIGITPNMANLAAMTSASTKRTSGGTSGGTPSKGTSDDMDYDGLFAAAYASGNPQSWLAQKANYSKYGFSSSSGLYKDYQTWLKNGGMGEAKADDSRYGGSDVADRSAMKLFELRNDIKGYKARDYSDEQVEDMLVAKLTQWAAKGEIDDEMAQYLAKTLGY